SKDETHREFVTFAKKAQRMYESEIKAIKTDNGTEFKNYIMQEFVDDEGIMHEFSAPYTPQQNGVVERKNRTIIEMARTMLSEFNLPHNFWGEAISTAVHYSNRLFLHPLHNKTPYELLTASDDDPSNAIKLMGIGHIRPTEVHTDDQSDEIEVSSSAQVEPCSTQAEPSSATEEPSSTQDESHSGEQEESPHPTAQDHDDDQETSSTHDQAQVVPHDRLLARDEFIDHEGTIQKIKAATRASDMKVDQVLGRISKGEVTRRHHALLITYCQHHAFVSSFEPLKVHEALVDPDWVIAMQEELECVTRNEVWSLVERPKDHRINVIGTKWVFKNKEDENGIVIRNKARKFEMSMMGELKFFLGFQVRQLAKGTFISQEKYVKDMLKKFNMANASPMKTPMPVKGQLSSCDGEKDVDIKLYQVLGLILFAANPPSWVNLAMLKSPYYHPLQERYNSSTSAALDSPSVISQLVSPPQASHVGTSAESENSSDNFNDASTVLDDNGSLGSFLDATIARSRQIENAKIPNENTVTPINSSESVEHSSDDLDEDYVELDDDFIDKCNATTDNDDASDKEEVEDEPEKQAKNKKYTKEDFIAKKHATWECLELTSGAPQGCTPPAGAASKGGAPTCGTTRKIENSPRALTELYREVTNDDSRTIQRGKIRNIQLPAIRYFAYYLATSILGRENTSNISSFYLAFLVAALTGSTPYHLGALIARRLASKGPIYGGIISSCIVTYLELSVDPSDEKLAPIKLDIAAMKSHQFFTTDSSLENIVYKMLFIGGDEREIPLPHADLFSIHRRPWSRSKEEVDEQLRIRGFHQQHDSEDAEPSDRYTVTYPSESSNTYQGQDPSSSYYGGATSWAPWD
ncbi:hypothetical protein QYE76_008356, partial [Lolium multiflorum]